MVWILTARHVDVQIHAQLIGKGGKKLVRQIRIEISDPSGTNLDVVEKIGPAAQVNDYLRQRFIEGTARLTEAADAMPSTWPSSSSASSRPDSIPAASKRRAPVSKTCATRRGIALFAGVV